MPTVSIVGMGNIGKEIFRRCKRKKWGVKSYVNTEGVHQRKIGKRGTSFENFELNTMPYDFSNWADVDIAFIAIPTMEEEEGVLEGATAVEYMKFFHEAKKIVTCEKGSLANHLRELIPEIWKIGYSATVGGGTGMIDYVKNKIDSNVNRIHTVVNGTLNYIFDGLSNGEGLEDMVTSAQREGFAEPGANNVLDLINGEIRDTTYKTTILANMGIGSTYLRAADISHRGIDKDDLDTLLKDPEDYRFVVSFRTNSKEEELIGGYITKAGKWNISGGFKRIDNPELGRLRMPRESNGVLIYKKNASVPYFTSGAGAGPEPTVDAMMWDAVNTTFNATVPVDAI